LVQATAIGWLCQTTVPDAFCTLAQGPTPHGPGPSQGWLEWLWTTSEIVTDWPDAYFDLSVTVE